MIIKGQAFTFMYETRDKHTGMLVSDRSSTHTIRVYYKGDYGWVYRTIIGQPSRCYAETTFFSTVYIGQENSDDTGLYLCKLDENETRSDHIVVSITSSNTDVVIPMQQFYPVDMSQFSSSGNGASAASVAEYVWHYGETNFNPGTQNIIATRTIASGNIPQDVWSYGDTTETRTAFRTLAGDTLNPEISSATADYIATQINAGSGGDSALTIAEYVWNYGNDRAHTSPTEGVITTRTLPIAEREYIADKVWGGSRSTRSLTTESLGNNTYLALKSDVNSSSPVEVETENGQGTVSASDIATQVLSGIPNAVWNMTIEGNTPYSRMERIADYVWGRNPREDERSLTTNVLDAFRSPTLALSSEVNTGTDFDPSTITFPDTTQIATAVWNYGKASGVGNKNFRSLSNTAIVNSDGTTSKYIGTLSSSTNTIDAAVWASTDKTLSSADIDDGTTIATTTDIPSIENLTDMLTKIFGVLCHWELSGDNIIVKNDSGDTILTIPTVKDKFGDIIQMDGISETLP